ncbi:probable leucine-rich repeat receptor-like protein kinase At1g68400 [Lolium rigidum]|uniref:probable leucine-rich repeat receptor-like protein kinase At1g68400 n=1 Tax=Lolium rigidum TaxID=89674 RepID=UPI001F5C9E1F|nr:probable leucine-rich repeat receptor-like protein kinase At1g68400 [Lolium rigidum]
MRLPSGSTALLLLISVLLHHSACTANAGSLDSDAAALAEFRLAADRSGTLTSWNLSTTPSPCGIPAWRGVTCGGGRVTRLVLEGLGLSGADALRPLASLDALRVLSLKGNALAGAVPDLSPLLGLKLLFLSRNALSGEIPPSLGALYRLYRLDLSSNNLSGAVPPDLSRLDRLLTLRLDSNRLTGGVDRIALPRLQDFNVSNNLLSGKIPVAMAGFPAAAFGGNAGLCGTPLPPCVESNTSSTCPPAAAMAASSPSSKPSESKGRMSRGAVAAIVAADFAVVGLVAGLLFCYFWPRLSGRRHREGEKIVFSSSPYGATGAVAAAAGGAGTFERGKMVFLEEPGGGGRRFELEELLRASAEMLGKGGCGTAYKAVLDDGSVVAVKRLRDAAPGSASAGSKKEFEHHMAVLGRLRHPNVVPLNAYYYARDERLLVYEFMPNGSLFSLLHGNRGPGRTPLHWAARVHIAAGAARGLAFIHHASRRGGSGSPKLAHGNIKSTNILIDRSGEARLADCGLAQLSGSSSSSAGYRAPEAPPARPWASQKGDVYAFGVVLLELLTGRVPGGEAAEELPRWVQSVVREEWTSEVFDLELMKDKGIEEEMVAMLQLALSCAAAEPGQRPKVAHVVRMIDEVRAASCGGASSPSRESSMDESSAVSDSPAVSEGGAVSQ